MKIAFGSMFQNSMKYIDRYIAQFYSLKYAMPDNELDPILIEGDSTDSDATWDRLNQVFPGHIVKRQHGGPIFGQVDNLQRWMQISYACNGFFENVREDHDAAIYVESDLLWEASTMIQMLAHLETHDAISPMCMKNGRFYDTWGFRKDGRRFEPPPPFHPCFKQPHNGLIPIDSGGSCIVMKGDVARKCRFRPPTKAMVGFFEEMKANGYSAWLDPSLAIYHP